MLKTFSAITSGIPDNSLNHTQDIIRNIAHDDRPDTAFDNPPNNTLDNSRTNHLNSPEGVHTIGYIHSIESLGTVDGPGVRMVVFLKGCPMRCLYCHNPDTWTMKGASPMTVEQILEKYRTYLPFYKKGGLTVSGGEPLMQAVFVIELFREAKGRGIHTCLDTSGVLFRPDSPDSLNTMSALASVTDLVLLDIKHIDSGRHLKLTGHPNENILAFARFLDEKQVPVWIRHVVVPGYTDDEPSLKKLGAFLATLRNVKALDVLPYHDMGKAKYEKLGLPYALEQTPPASQEDARRAKDILLASIRQNRLGSEPDP